MTPEGYHRIFGPVDYVGWMIYVKGTKAEMYAAHPLPMCLAYWAAFKFGWKPVLPTCGRVLELRIEYRR